MMKFSSIFLLIAALAATPVMRAADIVGKITFKGTPPAEVSLADAGMGDNADCMAMYKVAPRRIIMSSGRTASSAT